MRPAPSTSAFPFPRWHDALACVEGKAGPGGLAGIGWSIKRQSGSHRTLARPGWPDFVFAFHDGEEIGPRMLARMARHTGLSAQDL
ncbi:MAG: type II toxin-antitoxin system HicA family toxin [Rhodanobacter sp.]